MARKQVILICCDWQSRMASIVRNIIRRVDDLHILYYRRQETHRCVSCRISERGTLKGHKMYRFGKYIYDQERLLVYCEDICQEELDRIIERTVEKENIWTKTLNTDISEIQRYKMIAVNSGGICLTYNCNLNCVYCGYSSDNKSKVKISYNDIKAFVDDLLVKRAVKSLYEKEKYPLVLYITGGGEPTCEWELLKKTVAYTKNMCKLQEVALNLSITTNGLLSDEKIDYLAENFDNIMISYDGDKITQNQNRPSISGDETNRKVEHTIRSLVNKGVKVEIRSTICPKDFSRLMDLYANISSIINKKENTRWSIYPVIPEGRALKFIGNNIGEEYKAFSKYYVELRKNIVKNEGVEAVKKVFCPLYSSDRIDSFCGCLFGEEPCLMPNGDIITCNESKDFQVCIGHIKNGTIKWKEVFTNVFFDIAVKKYQECKKCIAYRFCRGGCPIWHLREDRSIPIECIATKEFWKTIIKEVIEKGNNSEWYLKEIDDGNHKIYTIEKQAVK